MRPELLVGQAWRGTCSFCNNVAVTSVEDDNDIFPACRPCADAWAIDPGFTGTGQQGVE